LDSPDPVYGEIYLDPMGKGRGARSKSTRGVYQSRDSLKKLLIKNINNNSNKVYYKSTKDL
jgi:hypothetical protein